MLKAFGDPVRVIRQANQGESVARNRALAEARGSHVLFLDADDLLEASALSRLVGALESRPDAVAIMGCAWFSEDPGAPYAVRLPETETFYPTIIESNLAPPHCWLAPAALVRSVGGFFADLRWFEDWDLWWRVGLDAPALDPRASRRRALPTASALAAGDDEAGRPGARACRADRANGRGISLTS